MKQCEGLEFIRGRSNTLVAAPHRRLDVGGFQLLDVCAIARVRTPGHDGIVANNGSESATRRLDLLRIP